MSQDTTTEDEDVSYLAPVPLGQSDWGGITSTQAPSRTPLPIPDMDIYIVTGLLSVRQVESKSFWRTR